MRAARRVLRLSYHWCHYMPCEPFPTISRHALYTAHRSPHLTVQSISDPAIRRLRGPTASSLWPVGILFNLLVGGKVDILAQNGVVDVACIGELLFLFERRQAR